VLDILKHLYTRIPSSRIPFLKQIPDRFLFGRSYDQTCINEKLDRIESYLWKALQYTRQHTEYGRTYMRKQFLPSDSFRVLQDLPLVSSSDLSENLEFYQSDTCNKNNSYLTSTGGTGRNPTSIRLSNSSFGIEWKHMHFIWGTCGYQRKQHLKLTFRGVRLRSKRLTQYNPLYNELMVDSFRLTQANFKTFIQEIAPYRIRFIHGYPSLLREFMDMCTAHKFSLELNGIFLGSENIYPGEKEVLSDFFHCKVIAWYGQSEKVVLAYDPVMDNRYRVFTSYGYPRIINPDLNGYGEISGTTFVNPALPLVNYCTGDYGKLQEFEGTFILTEITGRWGKDFVYLNKEKKIPTTSINIHSAVQREILFYQIHQSEFGILQIKILPKRTTNWSEAEIIKGIEKDLGSKLPDFIIHYRIIDDEKELVRSHRGKMIMMVQNLKQ